MPECSRILALSLSRLLAAAHARADEVTLSAAADTTLYDGAAALSNGRGLRIFAGVNGARRRRRALIRFDVQRVSARADAGRGLGWVAWVLLLACRTRRRTAHARR